MTGNLLRIVATVLGGLAVLVAAFLVTLGILNLWDRQEQILQAVIVKNTAGRVEITQPIPPEQAKARVTDGAALADATITPKEPNSVIRVHIRTYLGSDRIGTAVLAVFREGQEEPINLVIKSFPSSTIEEVISLFEFPTAAAANIKLHFRIGPADERPILLNYNRVGPSLETIVTIHEVKVPATR